VKSEKIEVREVREKRGRLEKIERIFLKEIENESVSTLSPFLPFPGT
jgi:hypothetical protein